MIEYVADSMHEAHVAPMLHDARVARLVFANPVQRRLRYPFRLRSRTGTSSIRRHWLAILCRGRWGRVSSWRQRQAVPRQLASHIRR
jgi:hypothetical protein